MNPATRLWRLLAADVGQVLDFAIVTLNALRCAFRNRLGVLAGLELVALCWVALCRADSRTSEMNLGQVRGFLRRQSRC
jgi:hypothetical protein